MHALFSVKLITSMRRLAVCCLLALLTQVANAADFDALVGIYSFRTPYGDQDIDVVKVEKEGSEYIAYTNTSYAGLEWSSGEVALPAKPESYADMLANAEFDSTVIGLETPKIIILRLPAGWHSGPYKTDTGFLWISYAGAFEVKKREPGK